MRLHADFNGLFGDVLCLSHNDTSLDANGAVVELREGMLITAFEEDLDDQGRRGVLSRRFKTGCSRERRPDLHLLGFRRNMDSSGEQPLLGWNCIIG